MKNVNSQYLWEEFLDLIDSVNDDPGELTNAIQKWMRDHLNVFSKELLDLFKTSAYILSIDTSDYPIYFSNVDIANLKHEFHNMEPKNVEEILSKLLDALWEFVSYKTNIRCPQCNDDELRCLFDPTTRELVLSCDICSWTSTLSGDKWNSDNYLIPAKKVQLAQYLSN